MELMLAAGGRRVAPGRPQGSRPIAGEARLDRRVALLWQRRLGVREGDGDGGVVGVGGRVELRSVSGVARLLACVLSVGVLRSWVVEV